MARSFNGTSDYISLADNAALTLVPPWTIGGWIRVAVTSTLMQFISWYDGAASDKLDLYLRGNLSPENTMSVTVVDSDGDSDTFYAYTTPRIGTVTTWQHYLLRLEANGQFSHFLNGVQYGGRLLPSIGTINPATGLLIGKRSTDTWYWNGEMAELAKWDRALSNSEISEQAAGACPLFSPEALAWYLPLREHLREVVSGIAVTNSGSTLAAHPTIAYPTKQSVIQPTIQPAIAG